MSVRSGKTHTLRFLQTFKIKKASQNNEEDTKKIQRHCGWENLMA